MSAPVANKSSCRRCDQLQADCHSARSLVAELRDQNVMNQTRIAALENLRASAARCFKLTKLLILKQANPKPAPTKEQIISLATRIKAAEDEFNGWNKEVDKLNYISRTERCPNLTIEPTDEKAVGKRRSTRPSHQAESYNISVIRLNEQLQSKDKQIQMLLKQRTRQSTSSASTVSPATPPKKVNATPDPLSTKSKSITTNKTFSKCPYPLCRFQTREGLWRIKQHMQTHYNVKPFKCDKCQRQFASNQSKNQHLVHCDGHPAVGNQEPEPKSIRCPVLNCGRVCGDWQAFQGHIGTHDLHVTDTVISGSSPAVYVQSKNASSNNKIQHQVMVGIQSPPKSSAGGHWSNRIMASLVNSGSAKVFRCTDTNCNFFTRKQAEFETHMRDQHQKTAEEAQSQALSKQKTFKCPKCFHTYAKESLLQSHMRLKNHYPTQKKNNPKQVIKSPGNKVVIQPKDPLRCTKCNKRQPTLMEMRKHILEEHFKDVKTTKNAKTYSKKPDDTNQQLQCDMCPCFYLTPQGLAKHKENIHGIQPSWIPKPAELSNRLYQAMIRNAYQELMPNGSSTDSASENGSPKKILRCLNISCPDHHTNFPSVAALDAHIMDKHIRSKRPTTLGNVDLSNKICPFCALNFQLLNDLLKHIELVHPNAKQQMNLTTNQRSDAPVRSMPRNPADCLEMTITEVNEIEVEEQNAPQTPKKKKSEAADRNQTIKQILNSYSSEREQWERQKAASQAKQVTVKQEPRERQNTVDTHTINYTPTNRSLLQQPSMLSNLQQLQQQMRQQGPQPQQSPRAQTVPRQMENAPTLLRRSLATFQCPSCGMALDSASNRQKHMQTCKGPANVSGPSMQQTTANNADDNNGDDDVIVDRVVKNLNFFTEIVKSADNNFFMCPVRDCNTTLKNNAEFINKHLADKHLGSSSGLVNLQFNCNACETILPDIFSLLTHIKQHGTSDNPMPPTPPASSSPSHWAATLVVTKNGDNYIKCKVCQFIFVNIDRFMDHFRSKHEPPANSDGTRRNDHTYGLASNTLPTATTTTSVSNTVTESGETIIELAQSPPQQQAQPNAVTQTVNWTTTPVMSNQPVIINQTPSTATGFIPIHRFQPPQQQQQQQRFLIMLPQSQALRMEKQVLTMNMGSSQAIVGQLSPSSAVTQSSSSNQLLVNVPTIQTSQPSFVANLDSQKQMIVNFLKQAETEVTKNRMQQQATPSPTAAPIVSGSSSSIRSSGSMPLISQVLLNRQANDTGVTQQNLSQLIPSLDFSGINIQEYLQEM